MLKDSGTKSLRLMLLLVFTLFASAARVTAAEPIKIIIDTDIGEDIDDILCTAFALSSPEFEVLAITTVDGNVAARSRVARKVAQLYGVPELPVARGYVRHIPLADPACLASSGGVHYDQLAPDETGLPPESLLKADELIARLAEKYPGEITVVTIGSMTNVGQLLTRYPHSAQRLKQIVTNGGNFTQLEQHIGWNLRYDPLAALITARSRVPWVLLSESASRFCSLRAKDVERLRSSSLPTARLLVEAIDLWHRNKKDATPLPHVSDLNAFAYLLGGWLETVPGDVFIGIGSGGQLPEFGVKDDPGGRIMLGREISREKGAKLREIFMQRLLSEPAYR